MIDGWMNDKVVSVLVLKLDRLKPTHTLTQKAKMHCQCPVRTSSCSDVRNLLGSLADCTWSSLLPALFLLRDGESLNSCHSNPDQQCPWLAR